jgi:hypothetical protein
MTHVLACRHSILVAYSAARKRRGGYGFIIPRVRL